MSFRWTHFRVFAGQAAVISAVSGLLIFAASKTTPFKDFNSWTYDFTVLHAGLDSQSKDIVLVDFDEATFARIQKYPIPRSTIAEVVKKVGDQKPRVIGMDLFVSEPRTPAEDLAMQQALTSAGTVILASQTNAGGVPHVMPLPMFCEPEIAAAASGFCRDDKPGADGYAFVNMPMDEDGFIRHANLFFAGPPSVESFTLTLAQQYVGKGPTPIDDKRARFNGHVLYYDDPDLKTFLIGSWGHEPVPSVSALDLLDNKPLAHSLTNKLVLIGQSNDAGRDRHFTPLYRWPDENGMRLRMSGTEVQGAAIRSLLEGTVVRPAQQWIRWLLVLVFCWATAYALLSHETGPGVASAVVLAALPCGLSLLLYAKLRYWIPFLPMQAGVALTLPLTFGLQFALERLVSREAHAQRQQLMTLFSSYVDPVVANTIWRRRGEVSLFGEERVATVIFTDIRSFTSLSAGKPPAEVLRWLNQYMTAMDEVIREHGGFLNKFIGDGLMIIFGLPLSQGVQSDARRAMKAAIGMLDRVTLLNAQNAGDPIVPQLRIGIGVHTGSLMAGSIGSANRQEYSVIGETVNLASRLESLNKQFHTEILMSEATQDLLAGEFGPIRSLGAAKVAGFEQPVPVYTLDLEKSSPPPHFEMSTSTAESTRSEANAVS
jgi:adenylate cyclase